MPSDLVIDSEFKAFLSPLNADEYKKLEASIKADGCREALVGWSTGNILLDGHHRYELCEKHGKGYKVHYIDLPDKRAAMEWVLRNQMGRRNLTDSQRGLLAGRLADLLAPAAQARVAAAQAKPGEKVGAKAGAHVRQPTKPAENARTSETAAAAHDVSPRTVDHAKAVLHKGTEALQGAVRDGNASLTAAAAVATLPKDQQDKIVAKGGKAVAKAAAAIRKGEDPAEPPPAAPVEKDALGHVLPEKLRPVFAAGEEVAKMMRGISTVKGAVLKLAAVPKDQIWGRLDVGAFTADVDHARQTLKAILPYATCPYCQGGDRGSGKGCTACEGRGWLDVYHYRMAPKELQ